MSYEFPVPVEGTDKQMMEFREAAPSSDRLFAYRSLAGDAVLRLDVGGAEPIYYHLENVDARALSRFLRGEFV